MQAYSFSHWLSEGKARQDKEGLHWLCEGLPYRLLEGLAHGLAYGLAYRLAYGLAYGLAHGLAHRLAHGLAHWLAHWLAHVWHTSVTRAADGLHWLCYLAFSSKIYHENSIPWIFMPSSHQVHMKNVFKYWKDFLRYSSTS